MQQLGRRLRFTVSHLRLDSRASEPSVGDSTGKVTFIGSALQDACSVKLGQYRPTPSCCVLAGKLVQRGVF